jgi:hypothetical protein
MATTVVAKLRNKIVPFVVPRVLRVPRGTFEGERETFVPG